MMSRLQIATRISVLSFVLTLGFVRPSAADDWPQWFGPRRDGKSAETGLLKQWPEGGPPLLLKISGTGA